MRSKKPLMMRIVIAFVLMTVIVSGLFSLSIVAVVHLLEEHLVSEEMLRELQVVLHEDLQNNRPPRLDASTQFFSSKHQGYSIPEQYTALEPGFTEVVNGEMAYYVYTYLVGPNRFVLVQEQHEFEAREQALFNVVLAGFLLSVLGAWGLGWLMAKKVMTPVSRLAQQVRHRDQLLVLAPPLAPEYSDDEVGQLAAAFDSTLGQLRLSLERERLFTSDVSHELRTPLMVIASSCELLQQASLEPRQHEQVNRIARASQEMRDLVEIFLQLARSKNNETVLSANNSLQQIADEQFAHWQPLMREKGLSFELLIEQPNSGSYNSTLLRSVLSNLLRNAWHYTEHGQVQLILSAQGFRVEDTGAGIPQEQHEAIFQPFVRGSTSRGEGLGLGLSLVKRICLNQGWSISVQSHQDSGSCFSVKLAHAL